MFCPTEPPDTRDFVENQELAMQNPGMNPIEHLCDQMVVHIHDMENPSTTEAQLHMAVALRLFSFRPLHAVLAVRGGHMHYWPNLDDATDPFHRLQIWSSVVQTFVCVTLSLCFIVHYLPRL